jgi:hypothetical protein
MPNDFTVTGVDGLQQLSRDLKELDPKLAKELQKTNKAAVETVASKARSSYGGQHQSRSGAASSSIRALASQQRAQVALGSGRAPYVLGQEFGSGQGPHKRQFPPYNAGQGNFFYPAVRAETADLAEKYAEMLDDLLRASGWD